MDHQRGRSGTGSIKNPIRRSLLGGDFKKTVRCDGISVDPLDQENVLNIPDLMMNHFPEYGPYLGVYAVVDKGGAISLGDDVSVVQ
jgi:hypothetical protein